MQSIDKKYRALWIIEKNHSHKRQ